jgi:hypothetical protein
VVVEGKLELVVEHPLVAQAAVEMEEVPEVTV